MKFATILGAVLALAQNTYAGSSFSSQSTNFIKNGDFKQNDLGWNTWVITNRLAGWETAEIQQGIGSTYNSRWGNTIVLELDAHSNASIKQKIDLQAGDYELTFSYAARVGQVQSSAFSVLWNGKLASQVAATDEEIHNFSVVLTSKTGSNLLEIRGEGPSDSYGMAIANVKLVASRKVSSSSPLDFNTPQKVQQKFTWRTASKNFFSNGAFDQPQRTQGRDWLTSFPGWDVKRIRHGIGNLWNKRWGTRPVVQIDVNPINWIKQTLDLSQGLYRFELEHAVAQKFYTGTGFSIFLNNQKIASHVAEDADLHLTAFNFSVDTPGQFVFEIRYEGPSNGSGPTFGQASLFTIKKATNGKQPCFEAQA